MEWNVILNTLEDNKILPSKNNPKESGDYLCTCIQYFEGKEVKRYLQIMTYNKDKNYWHDLNHEHGISHIILAWTNAIKTCDFKNFYYSTGYLFEYNNLDSVKATI